MGRISASGAQDLYNAYTSVYAPVITEEVLNQTTEQWVAACIQEGVNFEEYTLDEITEAFIADCDQPEVLNEFLGMPGAQNFGANLRQGFGRARRAVGGALANVGAGVRDVAGAGLQGYTGQRTTSKNPLARAANAVTRAQTALPRASASMAGGFLTGRPATKPAPAPTGTKTAPAPTGTKRAPAPVAAKPAPVAAKPAPTSTSVAGTFKPVAGAPTQASLATARSAPEKTNILGNKASDLAAAQAKAKADSLAQAAKNRARGQRPMSARERMLNQDLDLFDIVKGYLLDEGATEEEALKRMAVMTEEERNEIIESSCGGGHSKKKKKKSGY